MKKSVSYILAAMLVCVMFFAFGGTAYAADVAWSASFSPSELASGGTVTFSTSVTNNAADPVTNVTLYYPDGTAISLSSSLPAGDSVNRVDENFSISSEQLGQKQEFKLEYTTSDNVQHTLTGTATVGKKAGSAKVTGSASSNKSEVENSGDKVTITFNFKNSGDVKVSDCRLFAPPINGGDEITQNPFSLEPGVSKTLTYTTQVTGEMSIVPKLTYSTEDGSSGSVSLDAVKVKVAGEESEETEEDTAATEQTEKGKMTVTAVADKAEAAAGDQVEFEVTVENTGNADLTNLKVADSAGNMVSLSATSLAAGEKATGKLSVTFDAAASYAFSASAETADGTLVKADSGTVAVALAGGGADTPKGLYIDVVAGKYELEEPGETSFAITVTNTSDIVLTNVVVTEQTLGDIVTIPTMGTDVKSIEHKVNVDKTTDYVFTVKAQLADGTEVSATTDPITINVEGGIDILTIVLIIVIAAAGALAAVFLILRNRKKQAAAASSNKYGKEPPARQGARRSDAARAASKAPEAQRPMRTRTQRSGAAQQQSPYVPADLEIEPQTRRRSEEREYDFTVDGEDTANVSHAQAEASKAEGAKEYRRQIDVSPARPATETPKPKKRHGDRNNF